MKYLGPDKKTGLPKISWCCPKAMQSYPSVINFLDDGNRKYDSDRTAFCITSSCSGSPDDKDFGKHYVFKINFCPFCGSLCQDK